MEDQSFNLFAFLGKLFWVLFIWIVVGIGLGIGLHIAGLLINSNLLQKTGSWITAKAFRSGEDDEGNSKDKKDNKKKESNQNE